MPMRWSRTYQKQDPPTLGPRPKESHHNPTCPVEEAKPAPAPSEHSFCNPGAAVTKQLHQFSCIHPLVLVSARLARASCLNNALKHSLLTHLHCSAVQLAVLLSHQPAQVVGQLGLQHVTCHLKHLHMHRTMQPPAPQHSALFNTTIPAQKPRIRWVAHLICHSLAPHTL